MDGTRKECTIMFSSSQREGINHTFFHNPSSEAPERKGRTSHSSKIGLFWSSAWCFHWASNRPECITEPFLSTAGETEVVFLTWSYAQILFLCPSPSNTVPFPFGHCQTHISERKKLFKPSCNWFWHLLFKAAGSAAVWARQSPGRGCTSSGHVRASCLVHTFLKGVGFWLQWHYKLVQHLPSVHSCGFGQKLSSTPRLKQQHSQSSFQEWKEATEKAQGRFWSVIYLNILKISINNCSLPAAAIEWRK